MNFDDPVLPEVLKAAIDEYVPPLGDWTSLKKAYQMAALILEKEPRLVIEIGVFKGQSFLPQAFALRHNNIGGIVGIDPWEMDSAVEGSNDPENNAWWETINLEDEYQGCCKLIKDHNLHRWCCLIRSASQYVWNIFDRIDILNIDGNHSEEASCRDVDCYVPWVRHEGYVWMDDVSWPSTKEAQNRIEALGGKKVWQEPNYTLYQMLHSHA